MVIEEGHELYNGNQRGVEFWCGLQNSGIKAPKTGKYRKI